MTFDSYLQRQIMGRFATGVTVASTISDGEPWGMTANAVASLSLQPPLVLLAITRESQSYAKFKAAGCFGLSILTAHQKGISDRFASTGPRDFSGLDYETSRTGSPILTNSLAWVDCKIVNILPGGDHDIFIGEILAGGTRDDEPLLFFCGQYRRIAPACP